MLFNSTEFLLVFLPIVLAVFYALQHWRTTRGALIFLVIASLFFYGWWEPIYLILIIGSTTFNFFAGRYISSQRQRDKNARLPLTIGIVVNLGLLGFFKYANFFISTANSFGGSFTLTEIILPLAISFFTFQQIAFLVDAYENKVGEPSYLNYTLFVTFFPQLIAGPIVHHKEMIPQFLKGISKTHIWNNISIGLAISTIGLFKKTVLADKVAFWADQVFGAAARGVDVTFIESWVGALSFSLQIYFDFSGYSDMAIGVARMFGILLPLNFASPYKSTSIIIFWRTWHMTLSRFLRDYLYVPLGGNRNGRMRRYTNLMVVMLLGGLWHGAHWTFVAWGGVHGFLLILNHAWHWLLRKTNLHIESRLWRSTCIVLTFLSVTLAWVFFRADSFTSSLVIYKGLVGMNGFVLPTHYAGLIPNLEKIFVSMGGGMGKHANVWRWNASALARTFDVCCLVFAKYSRVFRGV